MSKKAACKCHEEECECPEWIFTFADLVMLMMGFFVILWVIKPAPGKQGVSDMTPQYIETAAAIRDAFGYTPNPSSNDPIDQAMVKKIQMLKMYGPGEKGRTTIKNESTPGTDEEVTSIRPARQSTVGVPVLFDPGSATLRPETMRALDEIAKQIRGHRNIVLIKGHTDLDDLPDNASDQAKMDLSLKRAQAAADYLVRNGVEADVLRVQGCSTFEPVTQRVYTTAGRAANRRVEVEATPNIVEQFDGTPTTRPNSNGGPMRSTTTPASGDPADPSGS
jgi:chemotaxis protein MotB